jgi:putative phosphotransacetylase
LLFFLRPLHLDKFCSKIKMNNYGSIAAENEGVSFTMSMEVLVETSARHLHVTQEVLETLFGKGYELTKKKDLSQPGQYACAERVDVVGPKKTLAGVSILGPVRPETQVELSLTDARSIGVAAPVRESGDIAGSGACKLVGPCGEVEISEGVIAAKRHIHMTTADAERMGLTDKQIVSVQVACGNGRDLTFGDVVVRVSDKYALAMHIDTDESNAGCIAPNAMGTIIK